MSCATCGSRAHEESDPRCLAERKPEYAVPRGRCSAYDNETGRRCCRPADYTTVSVYGPLCPQHRPSGQGT